MRLRSESFPLTLGATLFKADLHCHSTCSDGSFTPHELIVAAKQSGLQGLSITDHDTTKAYESAIQSAETQGIDLLPGVEFSTQLDHNSVHILGYAFSPFHPAILSLCEGHAKRRHVRNHAILERLKSLGMPLEMRDLEHDHTIGRPHIAQAMVKKGYVSSIQEAFKKYIADGGPAYVSGASFSAEETLEIIHKASGFAVIAHPHLIDRSDIVRKLLEMPFDGIECFYGNFSADQNERWIKIANKKGWMMTGGSDFHGAIKPQIPLGSSWIGTETFSILTQRYIRNR